MKAFSKFWRRLERCEFDKCPHSIQFVIVLLAAIRKNVIEHTVLSDW